MNRLFVLFASTMLFQPLLADVRILTWEEASARALQESYDLRMEDAEIEGREGDEIQSRLYDNPIVSYNVENVFGNKRWRGWRAAESRYEIAQPLAIGGRRGHLAKLSEYRVIAAEKAYEATQIEVLNRLSKAFLEVAVNQELYQLAVLQKEIAEEVSNSVSEKLNAGKISPIHRSKTMLELVNANMALEIAEVDLQVSKENLALLFSSPCIDFLGVVYPLFQLNCPSFDECIQGVGTHPALLRVEYEQLASEEGVLFEKAFRIPDLIVSVGYKTVQDTHERGMIMGATIPLPLFNRNQGNIQRATAERRRLMDQIEVVQLKLENKLSTLYKELFRAYDQAVKFKTSVLQIAEEAFEYAKSGYSEGKLEYLDLLDAKKTLFQSQERYIQVLLEYHTKCQDLEYLTL